MNFNESQLSFEDAKLEATRIKNEIENQGLDSALENLDKALNHFKEAGYPIEALIPADTEANLGFSITRVRDGITFWEVYAKVVRNELCKEDGELKKLAKAGLSGSVGAIISALMTGLGLPGVALGIVVPIAGILAAQGVDAFCIYTAGNADGS